MAIETVDQAELGMLGIVGRTVVLTGREIVVAPLQLTVFTEVWSSIAVGCLTSRETGKLKGKQATLCEET